MIGGRLKTLREQLGWTLKTLAEKCDEPLSNGDIFLLLSDSSGKMPEGIWLQGKIVGAWAGNLKQGI
jgi:transcriptional regulator with XRE-family HTH domain